MSRWKQRRRQRLALHALIVTDVGSIHLTRRRVAELVDDTVHRFGGPDGVHREATHLVGTGAPYPVSRRLAWARNVLDAVDL